MNYEDSNNEIYPFKSYEINVKNPVALNKKSEREKKIMQLNFNQKNNENLPEDKNQPIYNYPYEFYDESESKNCNATNKNQKRESKKEISRISKKEEDQKVNSKTGVVKKQTERKIERPKIEEDKKEEKLIEKINNRESRKQLIKKEIKTEESVSKEQKKIKDFELKNEPKKNDSKNKKVNKEEINLKNEEKKIDQINLKEQIINDKEKEDQKKNENKINEQKIKQNINEEYKIEKPKIIVDNNEHQKKEEPQIEKTKKEEEKIVELKLEKVEYKGLGNNNLQSEKECPPQIKEKKNSFKISEVTTTDKLPKTLLTKKTEDNYDLMMKYFKERNYKRGDDAIIDDIINYKDFSSDKYLGLVSEKIKIDNSNKELIDDFLQRNKEDTKIREDNNKTANERMKLIDESTKKKIFFNDKQSKQEFFDSFYNKQIQYKNNCKEHINKLINKYDEERKKNYILEPKNKNNLNYFKKNKPVKISKYSFKAQNLNTISNKNNNEEIIEEKTNKKEQENQPKKRKIKKLQSFGPNLKIHNKPYNNNALNNSKNNIDNINNNNKENKEKKEIKHLKKIKSGPLLTRKEIKLSKKEIEEITNALHYDGELSKIKKQIILNRYLEEDPNIHFFSMEKITNSSIIILIKKLLYDYCLSLVKNAYADYAINPKLNYEQYIDILKDLYYLEKDARPEDYSEEDTMYKELWNKLIQFSTGPVNSIESNVFLLFLFELNGYFFSERIIKEIEKELYWINIEKYDDLIANAKYIEDNWDDLRKIKIEIIKKLKLQGKYNYKHYDEFFSNHSIIKNNLINSNSSLNININNENANHFLTTLKGNTNYHLIQGYSSKNKKNENSFFELSNIYNENEKIKHNSLSFSKTSNKINNKIIKNKIPLQDSYKDIIEKKKSDIENMKKAEEKKIKEICTFKPQINIVKKKIFSKKIKIELPKYKKNKSSNIYCNNSLTQENNTNKSSNNLNQNILTISNKSKINNINNASKNITENKLSKNNNHNNWSTKKLQTPEASRNHTLKISKKSSNQNSFKRNKSSLQKMFEDNPLKKDKSLIEKIEKLKMGKINGKELENYNKNLVLPMRFDIEFPSKFEGIGININREENMRQRTHNVIFYNIKINEKMNILKYIEGDDLKLTVINFVRKNKLPEEVTDIILSKIKEKTLEENL